MKLQADVEIISRLLPSANLRGKGKSARAQLSIGRKSVNDDVLLLICTQQDRNGRKYKLRDNIEQMFTKFVHEGKSTIRFKEPCHDVSIKKADIVQLKSFLSILRLGSRGEDIGSTMVSSLAPASSKQVACLKTKMIITKRVDYPITESFPFSLETLRVNDCNLKCVDSRILRLRHLVVLDLSKNNIRSLPDDWSAVDRLSELHLAHNQLDVLPKSFCTGERLRQTLTYLDISDNRLTQLAPWFTDLRNLSTLKIDRNELAYLPFTFGCLRNLTNFSAVSNKLKTLPGGFLHLRLQNLDLSDNALLADGPSTAVERLDVPSLLECAARRIHKDKIAYTAEDIGYLMDYMCKVKPCLVCGGCSFTSNVHYLMRLDLRSVTSTLTALDTLGRTHAPCEGFHCSRACYEIYKVNPTATIWRTG